MVYERVRFTDIPVDGGSLVTGTGGVLTKYYQTGPGGSGQGDIDGRIIKIWCDVEDTAANGSLWIYTSGTGELVCYKKGSMDADWVMYPHVDLQDVSGTQITAAEEHIVTRGEPLYVVGSGLGNTKVINKIRIWHF